MRRTLATILMIAPLSLGVTACQTISEEACAAGDWEGIGFKDGTNGHSRARLADIAEACGQYRIMPDRTAYLRGLEEGLTRYCTPERGYARGRDGQGVNNECSVRGFVDYVDAHADGYAAYQIDREYRDLIRTWEETDVALANVTERLRADDLAEDERKRLRKKKRRLERRADEKRIDIRTMERLHGFPRWTPA